MTPLLAGFCAELTKVAFVPLHARMHPDPKSALMLPVYYGSAEDTRRERPTAGTYGALGGAAGGAVGANILERTLRPKLYGKLGLPHVPLSTLGRLGLGAAAAVGGGLLGARLLGGKKVPNNVDYEIKGRTILIRMPHESAGIVLRKPFGFDQLSPKSQQDWARGMQEYVEHQRRTGHPLGTP